MNWVELPGRPAPVDTILMHGPRDRWGVMRRMQVVLIQRRFWFWQAFLYYTHLQFTPFVFFAFVKHVFILDLGHLYRIWLHCMHWKYTNKSISQQNRPWVSGQQPMRGQGAVSGGGNFQTVSQDKWDKFHGVPSAKSAVCSLQHCSTAAPATLGKTPIKGICMTFIAVRKLVGYQKIFSLVRWWSLRPPAHTTPHVLLQYQI